MSLALATFFTSSDLSGGNAAASYGFNVTETGIGTKVVNVGANGAAFNVADNTDITIMALLLATHDMTGGDVDAHDSEDYSHVYDANGDGSAGHRRAGHARDGERTLHLDQRKRRYLDRGFRGRRSAKGGRIRCQMHSEDVTLTCSFERKATNAVLVAFSFVPGPRTQWKSCCKHWFCRNSVAA